MADQEVLSVILACLELISDILRIGVEFLVLKNQVGKLL